MTYDIFRSIATATGNAEIYDPLANSWSSITPGVNGTTGTLPLMSSNALGAEFGPALRLQDGRIWMQGANNLSALYDPATNSWAQGPSLPSGMDADDAPGAIAPNGHVIFTADTPLFHSPTKVFEYDPVASTYTDITPAGTALGSVPAFVTRMLVLPTGQVLLSDSSSRPWVYTPDAPVTATARPIVNGVTYNGGGVFTLTGSQINGQSSGSSYGDDVESDENFPIIRFAARTGNVYYARTFYWSTVGIDGGTTIQSVNFTLNTSMPAGTYQLILTGAGMQSVPVSIAITQAQVAGQ